MIFEILKYYAQFPDHNKVLEIFSKGRSELLEYGILQEEIKKMPDPSRITGLDYYIFGQGFDSVKQRVDSILAGTYLFVEIGCDKRAACTDGFVRSNRVFEPLSGFRRLHLCNNQYI